MQENQADRRPAEAGKQRVLVVDDENGVRHMLTHLLKKEGYAVKAVPGGKDALKELNRTRYSVVLSDIRMPDMDGMALLDQIIGEFPDLTVILMSAYGNKDQALEAIKHGAYDYISKPFKKDEVVLALRKAEERERLKKENVRLRRQLATEVGFGDFIGRSQPMQRVFATIRKIAEYKTTVLITGESGTGKELVARALHNLSPRSKGSFVAVNCGAIPEHLLESELFGHKRGAFTDATRDKRGLFEEANDGTLFLDEVGELPLGLQVKLLRVLQEENIRRLGDTGLIPVDVRVVAATARDLSRMVEAAEFRDDLFYRLNVFPIALPPLKDRREDIPLLTELFVARCNQEYGTAVEGLQPDAVKALMNYAWPGNVRELENTIQHAIILTEGTHIRPEDLPEKLKDKPDPINHSLLSAGLSIKKASRLIEEELIRRALAECKGNKTRAAKLLEISHRALLYKMKDYNIQGG